jgi:tripartite-type tricarboxylate transporter receptor subunit TctC
MHSSAKAALSAAAMLCVHYGAAGPAAAQAFPARPVTIVVGLAPGGPLDTTARLLGPHLSKAWGQTVIVENRPGANSTVAAGIVAKSPADGHTLLITTRAIAINASLYPRLPFDTAKAFVPVAMALEQPNLLVVAADFPARNVPQLLKVLKENPGKHTYASPGSGGVPHLAGEMFKSLTGTQIVHVPYKGAAPLMIDLAGGRIDMTFSSPGSSMAHISQGKAFPIAVASDKRSPLLPNVPTFAEHGIADFSIATWYGLFAPAGTPVDVVRKINAELNNYLKTDDARKRLSSFGATAVISTPEGFRAQFDEDLARFSKVVRGMGLQID